MDLHDLACIGISTRKMKHLKLCGTQVAHKYEMDNTKVWLNVKADISINFIIFSFEQASTNYQIW